MSDNYYTETKEGLFNKSTETIYDKETDLPICRTVYVNGKVKSFQTADELLKSKKWERRAEELAYLRKVASELNKEPNVVLPTKMPEPEVKESDGLEYIDLSDVMPVIDLEKEDLDRRVK